MCNEVGIGFIDEVRNGLRLCKSCHHAYDNGGHWFIRHEDHTIVTSDALKMNYPDKAAKMSGRKVNFLTAPPRQLLEYMVKKFQDYKQKRDNAKRFVCPKCNKCSMKIHKTADDCTKESWVSVMTLPQNH